MVGPQTPHIWLSILIAPNWPVGHDFSSRALSMPEHAGRAEQHHRNDEYIQDNALRRRSGL